MNDYLHKLLKNNGVARGWLYGSLAFLTSISGDLALLCAWLVVNRDKFVAGNLHAVDYLIGVAFVGRALVSALVQSANAVKAFLDQYLSKHEAEKLNPPLGPP